MNLDKVTHSNFPFEHWEFSNCLNDNELKEI